MVYSIFSMKYDMFLLVPLPLLCLKSSLAAQLPLEELISM